MISAIQAYIEEIWDLSLLKFSGYTDMVQPQWILVYEWYAEGIEKHRFYAGERAWRAVILLAEIWSAGCAWLYKPIGLHFKLEVALLS